MPRLDPLQIPLKGLHLIEASAGTGKTFTITLLYLRLLLEAGLEVDRILVVTFTNAATEELRDRIRSRLRMALSWLEGGLGPDEQEKDPLLADLLRRLPDGDRAGRILRDSLTRLDESAVHTIHGFCQRMLQEHAFESRVPFDVELTGDDSDLLESAMADFWRRRIAILNEDQARWVKQRWPTPAALLGAIAPTLTPERIELIPDVSRLTDRPSLEALHEQIQEIWGAERQAILSLLQTHPGLNRRSYTASVLSNAIQAMDVLVARFDPDLLASKEIGRLLPESLAEQTKSGDPPAHPLFDRIRDLRDAASRAEDLRRARLLTEARDYVRGELERRKAERRWMAYDDLLRLLARGLEGAEGEALARRIRERFPVALIDEFQDTDPLQYRIFRRLYRDQPACGLYLIGDPKQAIYAFRGADIFTYMQARRDLAEEGREHTLGTNWRSSSTLVRAVNHLFQLHDGTPFVYADIPFEPVAPGPEADRRLLRIDGTAPVPLEIGFLAVTPESSTRDGFIRAEDVLEQAAGACAERIAGLLRLAAQRRALLGDEPLRAGDIAVLVRTHREGEQVQRALRLRGIASASLSRQSVFATEEAAELAVLLTATAEPSREGLVRTALVTRLIGTTAAELEILAEDDSAWEALLGRFRAYREQWLETGLMVAFLALLHDQGIPARLLGLPDGERRMTNLLHLGELLHLASREHPGLDGLLRWLAERRASPPEDEAQELRLESDEGLVRIVTLHKSKGLEYPVVLIPFPWSSYRGGKEGPICFHDPQTAIPAAYLGESERDAYRALAHTEGLAERLRLFYVAVTRAKQLCVLYWGRVNQAEVSAPAYLFHRDPPADRPASRMKALDEAEIRADLESLAAGAEDSILIRDVAETEARPTPDRGGDRRPLSAARFSGRIPTEWRVVSYSGLTSGRDSELPDYDAIALAPPEEAAPEPAEPVFLFPRGIGAGHSLHGLLEQVDFPTTDRIGLERNAGDLLERYGLERRWSPVAADLVSNALDTPLDAAGCLRLRDLERRDRLSELEFHYPLARLDPRSLSGCLAPFSGYREAGQRLSFQPAEGLMRGFIDLIFRHQDRYFLADYKSNHLGDRLADYAPSGLARAMAAHRYDLQYLVYAVALHRYLGNRLRDYDYDRHFGGVYYLFLRGMRPGEGARFGVFFDRPQREVIESLDRLFASSGSPQP